MEGRLPPFALQSTGLAARYAFDNKSKLEKHLSVIEGGKNLGFPRYYQRILGTDPERLKMKGYVKTADLLQEYVDDGYSWNEFQGLVLKSAEQEEKDLIVQQKIMESKK